jgi:hypothetical protein
VSKTKEEGRETSTLGERGALLPIGIQDQSGTFHREIAFKRWTGGTMRELGKLRGDSRELGMAEHVVMVLSVLATKIGPHDFTVMKAEEKKLVIHQMYVGDVFYAYCYARLQSLGPTLALDITCPSCRHVFKFVGDLNSLTVVSIGKLDDAYWEYDLDGPITIRGKKVKTLSMGPARWANVMNAQIEGSFDIEGGKLAMVLGSIRGVKGKEDYPLTQEEIDTISGYDIEQIIGELDANHIGTELKLDLICPKPTCKGQIVQPINWGYQSFFASSSRSQTSGKSSASSSSSPTTQTEV